MSAHAQIVKDGGIDKGRGGGDANLQITGPYSFFFFLHHFCPVQSLILQCVWSEVSDLYWAIKKNKTITSYRCLVSL